MALGVPILKHFRLFQFALIGAYLDPSDDDEWVRLADLSVEHNNVNQAVKCYTNGKFQFLPFFEQWTCPSLLFR